MIFLGNAQSCPTYDSSKPVCGTGSTIDFSTFKVNSECQCTTDCQIDVTMAKADTFCENGNYRPSSANCTMLEKGFRSYTATLATKNTIRETYYNECVKLGESEAPFNRAYTSTDCTAGNGPCRCFLANSIETVIVDQSSESCDNGRLTYTLKTDLTVSDDYEISKTCERTCQPRIARRLRSGRSLIAVSELTTGDLDEECTAGGPCRGCKKCKDMQDARNDGKQPFKEPVSRFVFAQTGGLKRDIGGCAPFQCSGTTIWVSGGVENNSPYYDFHTADSCDTGSKITSLSKTTTYTFKRCNGATTHPFWIGPYTTGTGITGTGELVFTTTTEDVTYKCTTHSNMIGTLAVVNKCELDECEGCKMCHSKAEDLNTLTAAYKTKEFNPTNFNTATADAVLADIFSRRGPQEESTGDGSCMPACKPSFLDVNIRENVCKWKKCKGCKGCKLYRTNIGSAQFDTSDTTNFPLDIAAAFFRPRPRTIDSDGTRNANVPTKFYGGCYPWCRNAFNRESDTNIHGNTDNTAEAREKVCEWKSCSGCFACVKEAKRLKATVSELAYKFKNYNSTKESGTVKGACLGPMLCRSVGVFYNTEQCSNCA